MQGARGRRSWARLLAGAGLTLGCTPRRRASTDLWLGGDLHLGGTLPKNSSFLSQLSGVGVVNLEGPLDAGPGWSSEQGGVILRNHPRSLSWMKDAGIQGVSLINNHAYDLGELGYEQSQARLAEQGIQSIDRASQTRGPTLGTWTLVGAFIGKSQERGLQDQDLAAIRRLDARGLSVVVSLHIDAPPSHLPSPRVRAGVQSLVDAGARVVALHGSHVIGPVKRHARGIIAWGLGNLSFACPCSQEREGLILQLSHGGQGMIRARIYPILTGSTDTAVQAAKDPGESFELLRALESSPLSIRGAFAEF